MRIAIDAPVSPARAHNGVETATVALIQNLGLLTDSSEEYVVVSAKDSTEAWRPFIGKNTVVVETAGAPTSVRTKDFLRIAMKPLLPAFRKVRSRMGMTPEMRFPCDVPLSDGFHEGLGCDVLHFPHQHYKICAMPTIYCPHDLQHLHLPQFFNSRDLAYRETVYPAGCRFSRSVVVPAQWVKDDLIRQYHVDPGKVQVIPWAPVTTYTHEPTAEAIRQTREKHGISGPFGYYPATLWPHKNHMRLIEAVAQLRDTTGTRINMIWTGGRTGYWSQIEARIAELGLIEQVRFLGTLRPNEVRCLYRSADFVIIPSLFEGGAIPLLEAWLDGAPLACANSTMMPDLAGNAAVLFDPYSSSAIAAALLRIATDATLRNELRVRGARRLEAFTWERTARKYRSVYRQVGGAELTDEDRKLLEWDWMLSLFPQGEHLIEPRR